ncbi:Zinc finger matrin-type protein, partial [Pseudolycoriella hygida]
SKTHALIIQLVVRNQAKVYISFSCQYKRAFRRRNYFNMDVSTRLNDSNDLLSTSVGTDNSAETSKKTSSSTKETSSRSKRKNSRSKSPRSRRHRSKSRSFSPSSRRQRDPRLRGRRSRSTNRGPRSPPRGRKSGSRERYRGNRRNWSPRKKGPVSPPPIQPVNHGFNMPPPQMYTDGYNYPQSYAPPAPAYGTYDYSMQSQPPFAYPTQPVLQPVPPGDDFQQPNWVHAPHMTLPPPALIVPPPIQVSVETEEEKLKREAAVAKEKKTQRATLGKQREDYRRRAAALKRELNTLKEQRDDLISGSEPPSPTTKGFIKENDRLQLQIENKITSIENVIDMLTNIIGTNTSPTPSPPPPPSPVDDKYKSAQKINYVHYDPQMHWCKQCNIFPKTAKDFLIHLHSKEHQDSQKIVEPPWHDKPINDEMPQYPNAPTKRTPIRGLQFFVPTTGWYCTICSIWMGDLHCASLHLKSQTHANNYNDYNNLNPHFEVDWVSERHKAYEDQREKNPTAVADRPQQPAPVAPVPMPVPPPALTIEQEVME